MSNFDKGTFLNLYIFNNVRDRSFNNINNPYKLEVMFKDIFEAYYAFQKQIAQYEIEEETQERYRTQNEVEDYMQHMTRLNMNINSTVSW